MNKTIRIAAACTLIGGVAFADGIAPSDVTFEEYGEIVEPLTGMAGDADNGMVIMTTRGLGNCVACHQVTALAEHPYHGEVGPS
ncbi:MAG: sulfur oxidation c-type cytochrome SoxX, partial [Rhodobacteraceae bacterium]|nr:sulfur oxidation c-type cytochrome SoxX [Paracoccaceae bacterium]